MAEKSYYHDINLEKVGILKNARLNPLSTSARTALSLDSSHEGLVCYDTDLDAVYFWNGSAWAGVSGGGGVSDGDKGDVTISSSGSVYTIDAGVVNTTKLGGDITTAGKALLDDASAAAQRTTLGLGTAAVSAATDFAAASHSHSISEVTNLQTSLDNKLDDSQASVFGLSLLDDSDAAAARATLGLGTAATAASSSFAAASHSHSASDVTDFNEAAQDAVGAIFDSTISYSDATPSIGIVSNTSTQKIQVSKSGTLVGTRKNINLIEGSNVTLTVQDDSGNDRVNITVAASLSSGSGLTDAYASISDGTTTATASSGDTIRFRSANNAITVAVGSNDVTHGDNVLFTFNFSNISIAASQISDGSTVFAPFSHSHAISDTTGLQTALDNKLDDSQASVFGLSLLDDADAATARTTLGLGTAATSSSSSFAAASHTHTASEITDFNEAAQDAVGGMVDSTLVYTDSTPSLVRAALTGAITASAGSNTTALGSFTKSQLSTAVSDGDVLFVGDVTSNATHTGEVTGSTSLTIDKTAITGKTEVTAATDDYILLSDTSDSGNLKKTLVSSLPSGGGGGWTQVTKTTSESRSSNTTLTADTDIKITLSANQKVKFRASVFFDTTATADFKWGHTGPASPTSYRVAREGVAGGGTALTGIQTETAYNTSGITMLGSGASGHIWFEGFIINGSNAGDWSFTWAQNTTDANNTSVLAGSYVEYIDF